MSNKSSSTQVRHRTLSRLAAVGGTALLLSSLVMTFAASAASAFDDISPADITQGTANNLSGDVCEAADFSFVMDMSGSMADQGTGRPENVSALVAGVNDFVEAFNLAGGSGLYAGTTFQGDGASNFSPAGFQSAGTFLADVDALDDSDAEGLTPTSAGINSGAGNTGGGRSGVPNVMFVLTDGSPNVPPGAPLNAEATWLTAANAAVASANTARANGFAVYAVYLSTPTDPGDTNLPFDGGDDAIWAQAVMDEIGGGQPGDAFDADFSDFIEDLFEAIDCPLPETSIVTRASENVEVKGEIWDTAVLSGGTEPTGKITFKLYGPNDAKCDKTPVFTDEVEVDKGNNTYTSGKFSPDAAGTYLWIASYSGDDDNAPTTGKCGDDNESVTVTEPKEPDIDVEKLVSRGDDSWSHENAAQPGDVLNYRIIVENNGNADAEAVEVTDDINDILEHASYNDDCNLACD